jgi:CelD/BcsL family acetyltransferase involved in cellulose biosynthesis
LPKDSEETPQDLRNPPHNRIHSIGKRDLKIEIVADEREFHALEEIWDPLLTRSGARNIFLTFEWISTWWKHFGHRHALSIVVARSGGGIVALFPLMVTVREGFRQLGLISNKITDYKDIIIDSAQDRANVIRTILQALTDTGGWDFLLLNGFPEDSANIDGLKETLTHFPENRTIWRDSKVSLYVPLEGTYDEYLGTLKKSFRKNITEKRNRLEKEIEEFSYKTADKEGELDVLVDKIIDLNAVRWKEEKGDYSAFDDPSMREFYKDLARKLFPKGWINISTMYLNRETASMNMCFRQEGRYFTLITSFNNKFSRYSPGILHRLQLIKTGMKDGMKELDFLTGGEPHKYNFNPKERKMFTIAFFRRGWKPCMAYLWFFGIRPYLERMEHSPMRNVYTWYRMKSVRKG